MKKKGKDTKYKRKDAMGEKENFKDMGKEDKEFCLRIKKGKIDKGLRERGMEGQREGEKEKKRK